MARKKWAGRRKEEALGRKTAAAAAAAKLLQSCPSLCDPMDCTVHGILQARILEWVAFPFSRGSSLGKNTGVGCHFLLQCMQVKSESESQSCPTLWDPIDYTVHGILQARILEWVAFPFSRGSSQPRDRTQVSHIAGGFFTNWAIREADKHTSKFFLNKVGSELYYIALEKEKNRLFKIGGKN